MLSQWTDDEAARTIEPNTVQGTGEDLPPPVRLLHRLGRAVTAPNVTPKTLHRPMAPTTKAFVTTVHGRNIPAVLR